MLLQTCLCGDLREVLFLLPGLLTTSILPIVKKQRMTALAKLENILPPKKEGPLLIRLSLM